MTDVPLADVVDPTVLLAEVGLPTGTPWSPLRYLALRIEGEHVDRMTRRIVGLPWPWTPLATLSSEQQRQLTEDIGRELCTAWVRKHFHQRQAQLPAIFGEALPDLLGRLTDEKHEVSLEPLLDSTDAALRTLCRERRGNKLLRSIGLTLLATLYDELEAADAEAVAQSSANLARLADIRSLPGNPPTQPVDDLLRRHLSATD